MNLKAYLFDDDRGVSPVIGVILMVAITVILAAVIATFVMNMGPDQNTPANANWDGSFSTSGSADTFTLTHEGGGAATASEYVLSIEGAADTDGSNPSNLNSKYNLDNSNLAGDIDMTATDSATVDKSSINSIITGSIDNDLNLDSATIQLIWEDPGSDQTQIIETWEP